MKTTRANTSRKHGKTCNCDGCKADRQAAKSAKRTARYQAWAATMVGKFAPNPPGPPGIYAGGHPNVKRVDFEDLDAEYSLFNLPQKFLDAGRFVGRRLHDLREYPKKSDRFVGWFVDKPPPPVLSTLDRVYTLDMKSELFDAIPGEVTYLFHGTKCKNINSIIRESLRSSGKLCLLGPGVYLAPAIEKAIGYAGAIGGFSGANGYGIVLICAVKLGYEDGNYRAAVTEGNALLRQVGVKHVEIRKQARRIVEKATKGPWQGDHRFANAGVMAGAYGGCLANAEYCVRDARRVLPKLALVYKAVPSDR